MKRAVAAIVTLQPTPCSGCGTAHAPYGVGPPLREKQAQFCGVCWQFEPSTQAMFAERCLALLGDAA